MRSRLTRREAEEAAGDGGCKVRCDAVICRCGTGSANMKAFAMVEYFYTRGWDFDEDVADEVGEDILGLSISYMVV